MRGLVLAPCLTLLILVGPARIYVGAHWASDVIGAYLLGIVWLSASPRLYDAWLARRAGSAVPCGLVRASRRSTSND